MKDIEIRARNDVDTQATHFGYADLSELNAVIRTMEYWGVYSLGDVHHEVVGQFVVDGGVAFFEVIVVADGA